MGERRRKKAYHEQIRGGLFPCVYCGGAEPSSEPDHMPPRILFSRKQRPNDLVFPSCNACNRGSSAIDPAIAGKLVRQLVPHAEIAAEGMA